MIKSTCCFLGHRKIEITNGLRENLYNIIEKLIVKENVYIFLFGSKSQFDDLCYQIISELKSKYPYIKRIYVRAEFPLISEEYKEYLLKDYEDIYYPEKIIDAGYAVYVERNYEMIDKSKFCIVYYDENYAPPRRRKSRNALDDYQPKSGTKIAYDYALKKQKTIINIFSKINQK